MMPFVKKKIKEEKEKMSREMEESFHKQVEGYLTSLPNNGYSMVNILITLFNQKVYLVFQYCSVCSHTMSYLDRSGGHCTLFSKCLRPVLHCRY